MKRCCGESRMIHAFIVLARRVSMSLVSTLTISRIEVGKKRGGAGHFLGSQKRRTREDMYVISFGEQAYLAHHWPPLETRAQTGLSMG